MKKNTKFKAFFKSLWLLLRCLLSSLSFCAIWVGIALHNTAYGVWTIIISSVLTLLFVYLNLILPLIKLNK